jgi:hypothetical protein
MRPGISNTHESGGPEAPMQLSLRPHEYVAINVGQVVNLRRVGNPPGAKPCPTIEDLQAVAEPAPLAL